MNDATLDQLALELARGTSAAEAAKKIGVSPKTVYNALNGRPGFKARVADLRREMLDGALGKLADHATRAVDTLAELLDGAQPPTVRCSAARAILDNLLAVREHAELGERIAELEKRVASDGESPSSD